MIGKSISVALVAAAVALSFLLGLSTRPSPPSPAPGARAATRGGSPPARTGVGRAVSANGVGAVEGVAESAAVRVDVLEQVASGRLLEELYAEDVRDEAWAPRVEELYADEIPTFLALVLPEAKDVEVACKSSMCKVSFVVPAERAEVAFTRQQAMPLGERLQPFDEVLDDGRVRVGMFVGIGAEHRPFDRLTARYRELYQGRFAVPEDQLVKYFERDEARMREEKARMREEKARMREEKARMREEKAR